MGFKSFMKTLGGKVAPTIAKTFGGPLGNLAGEALEAAFGEKQTDEQVKELLASSDPATLLKLQEAENALTIRLAELGIESDKLGVEAQKVDAGDRDSARNREIKTNDLTPKVIAYLVITGFTAFNIALFVAPIPDPARDAIMRSQGIIDVALGMILTYYYGSSAGSFRKSQTIDAAVTKR